MMQISLMQYNSMSRSYPFNLLCPPLTAFMDDIKDIEDLVGIQITTIKLHAKTTCYGRNQ